MRLIPLALAALLLAGCSAPAATTATVTPASLKDSCAALKPVLAEFGQAMPDAARYGTYAPKVRALADAGDQSTKDAFMPLVTVMERGAKGGSVLMEQASVTMTLAAACGTAGAPLS